MTPVAVSGEAGIHNTLRISNRECSLIPVIRLGR